MSSEPTESDPGARSSAPRLPSLRVCAVLAAGMLAIGVAVGAAIGPAPEPSLAGAARVSALLPALVSATRAPAPVSASPAPVQPPAGAPAPTPTSAAANAPASSAGGASGRTPLGLGRLGGGRRSSKAKGKNAPSTAPAHQPKEGGGQAGGKDTPKALPALTSVWLIELSGSSFQAALEKPSAAPFITGQLLPKGTLETKWSSVDASALASETALLTGVAPQTLDQIVEPPCPEGAAGAQCAPETPGALSTADTFLSQVLPQILSSAAYKEHGLIVISFGNVGSASASGLPEGAASATLSTQPLAGVLVLSPSVGAGSRSADAFDPTSPRQSLEGLLR